MKAEKMRVHPEPNQLDRMDKKGKPAEKVVADPVRKVLFGADKEKRDAVKAEFVHAWKGYKDHAWGFDDLVIIVVFCHQYHPELLLSASCIEKRHEWLQDGFNSD